MKLYIDSASLEQISACMSWGIIDGVTTNPSLIKKAAAEAGDGMEEYIRSILRAAGKGRPVSLEVTESTAEGMLRQGVTLYKKFNTVADNVMIKIPVNPSMQEGDKMDYMGIEAIRKLHGQGIPVNCTLIFTPMQALLAAKAGATVVSPFAGRIDDYLRDKLHLKYEKDAYFEQLRDEKGDFVTDNGILSGVHLCGRIKHIFRTYGIKTEVLGASVRNIQQMWELAQVGCDIATVPYNVLLETLRHPKTYEGNKLFAADVVKEYKELAEPK